MPLMNKELQGFLDCFVIASIEDILVSYTLKCELRECELRNVWNSANFPLYILDASCTNADKTKVEAVSQTLDHLVSLIFSVGLFKASASEAFQTLDD